MNWDSDLTGPALNIAKSDAKRLRVRAGPGTGKSFALKRRVARLLEHGQEPERILVVTFTRNAAASLTDDLSNLGVADCKKVHVGTLHSYCFKLLNREEVFEIIKRTPRTILEFSSSGIRFEGGMIINDLAKTKKFGDKRDCKKRILAFEAAWARSQEEQPSRSIDPTDKLLESHLLSWLRFHRAMLVGELVPVAMRFLRDNPVSIELARFDHVIVDEYQDLNRADQEIIDLLAERGSLAIVGDSDQSIYGFRHANPEGIEAFQNRHPATHDEMLAECRRCPTSVVKLADCLIRENHPPGSPVRLQALKGNPSGKVHVIQWKSPVAEAAGISEYVKYLTDQGHDPGEILIIVPREILATAIQNKIDGYGIPTYSFFHDKALKKESAQRALALLTLLYNEEDRVALRWWLGHGSPCGRSSSYQKLREYCEESDQSPWRALEAIQEGKLALPGTSKLQDLFKELVEELAHLSDLNLRDLVDALLPPADNDCSVLRKIAEHALGESDDIDQLYEYVRDGIINPEVPDGRSVRIMSPQKAKGLSSKVVIVAGCIEGLFPGINGDQSMLEQDEQIREQRRLFYVAITRCKETLVLSSFASVQKNEAKRMRISVSTDSKFWIRQIASRFIGELGSSAPRSQDGLEWQRSGYGEAAGP